MQNNFKLFFTFLTILLVSTTLMAQNQVKISKSSSSYSEQENVRIGVHFNAGINQLTSDFGSYDMTQYYALQVSIERFVLDKKLSIFSGLGLNTSQDCFKPIIESIEEDIKSTTSEESNSSVKYQQISVEMPLGLKWRSQTFSSNKKFYALSGVVMNYQFAQGNALETSAQNNVIVEQGKLTSVDNDKLQPEVLVGAGLEINLGTHNTMNLGLGYKRSLQEFDAMSALKRNRLTFNIGMFF